MSQTSSASQTSHTKLARFARGYPVAAFLTMALPTSSLLSLLVALAEYDVVPGKSLPAKVGLDTELAASLAMIVTITASALLVTYYEGGRDAVHILLSRAFRWRVPLRWWLIAVAALPCLTVVLAISFGDAFTTPTVSVISKELISLLLALFLVNVWEELTWSGFMQTHLERRHNIFLVAALTSAPFAFVHMPIRVITGEATTVGSLVVAFIVLFVFCIFIRTAFAAMMRGALNSVLLAATLHTFFNRSNNVDGIAADVLSGSNRQGAAVLATVIVTVGLLFLTRRKLSRRYRHELDAAEHRSFEQLPG